MAARLLGLWVRIPPATLTSVSCECCCVLSGRRLRVGIITRPEESYRVCCVWMWSWSIYNSVTLAHQGLLRHVGGIWCFNTSNCNWRALQVCRIFLLRGTNALTFQSLPINLRSLSFLVEYITLRLDRTNEVEQWYVRHNYFIVLYHRLHVSTYIQVIFRPSFTGMSIKCCTCWDPNMYSILWTYL